MGYIRFPIETSPETLAQEIFDYIIARAPAWTPADGNLDTWIIRAIAAKGAEIRDLASDVQDTIFRSYGATLMGIPPTDALPSVGSSTWTMVNNAGYTIPANTAVSLINNAGDSFTFLTTTSIVVPPGSTTTAAGDVTIRALIEGAEANGLGGAGVALQLIDNLAFVQSAVMTGATNGGADAESDTDYLSRLVRRLRRLSQRPVVAQDFADATLDVSSEVARAVALDGYKPSDNTWNNPRTVTISAVKTDGTVVSAPTQAAIIAYFAANREANFIVYFMAPQYTQMNAHADIVVASGFASASVIADVVATIQDYFSSAKWGRDPNLSDATQASSWIETSTVYYNELIALVSNVPGVFRVNDLTVAKVGSALARVNVAITSPAGLTQPGPTITATAV